MESLRGRSRRRIELEPNCQSLTGQADDFVGHHDVSAAERLAKRSGKPGGDNPLRPIESDCLFGCPSRCFAAQARFDNNDLPALQLSRMLRAMSVPRRFGSL